ncbi:hypothetical protein USB125703_00446 [Pseudoclavibacter triregionum]|nr:hypothetical protein USB125703_00446 [Pseudoclavibacter triregionum]
MTGDSQHRFPFDDGPQTPDELASAQGGSAPAADFGDAPRTVLGGRPVSAGSSAVGDDAGQGIGRDRLADAVARSRTIDPEGGVGATRDLGDIRPAEHEEILRGEEADAFAMPAAAAAPVSARSAASYGDDEGEPTVMLDPEELAAARRAGGATIADEELDGVDDRVEGAYAPVGASEVAADDDAPTLAEGVRAEAVDRRDHDIDPAIGSGIPLAEAGRDRAEALADEADRSEAEADARGDEADLQDADGHAAAGSHPLAAAFAAPAAGAAALGATSADADRDGVDDELEATRAHDLDLDGVDDAREAHADAEADAVPARRTIEIDRTRPAGATDAVRGRDEETFAPLALSEDEEPLEKPRKHGNRGWGVVVAILSTLVFGALFAAVFALLRRLFTENRDMLQSALDFGMTAPFWVPVLVYLVIALIWALLVNRAGWWSYIVGGLIAAVAAAAAYPLGLLVQESINTGVWDFSGYLDKLRDQANLAPMLVAFIAAREVFAWVGGLAAARGSRLTRRHRREKAEYEDALAERETARVAARRESTRDLVAEDAAGASER